MDFLSGLPVWLAALVIVVLRIGDVSLGTLRTIAVVQGRLKVSVLVGFFEVSIWFVAVASALQGISDNWLLALAYAVGYAAGNAVGICLDRWLALGTVEVSLISRENGPTIAKALREQGRKVTTFVGEGRDGPNVMLYAICPGRSLEKMMRAVREIDPNVVYTVDLVQQSAEGAAMQLTQATGWRGLVQRK